MKTKEEMKELTNDELIAMVQSIEEEKSKAVDYSNYWYNQYNESTKKYENLKNVLNGIVSMI